MDDWESEAQLQFVQQDCAIATLRIVGPDALSVLPIAHSSRWFEQVRVREAKTYEWEVNTETKGLRIRETDEVSRSKLNPNTGYFRPGNNVGIYEIVLEDQHGEEQSSALVEIEPVKIGSREDFQQMLTEIAEHSVDLLLKLSANPRVRLDSDWRCRPTVLSQIFGVIRSAVRSEEFQLAYRKIVAEPHRILQPEEHTYDPSRERLRGRIGHRALSRSGRRLQLPSTHPLVQKRGRPMSIPSDLVVTRHDETHNTAPNQFVKHVLSSFLETASLVEKSLPRISRCDWVKKDARAVRLTLETMLADPVFREVRSPKVIDLGNPILQRKTGYREFLRTWVQFNAAATLSWSESDSLYSGGLRHISTLYEYWVFFRLLSIFRRVFAVSDFDLGSLFIVNNGGLELSLKSGKPWSVRGTFDGKAKISARFSFNRTFSGCSDWSKAGSWTRPMRPDYTVSLWPAEVPEEDAEKAFLIAHLHFDAKYRIDALEELSEGLIDLSQEKDEQIKGTYKRDDLLKMHAYRDAIRRTEGAYVLYPGDVNQDWQMYSELLPGLGAICLHPRSEAGDACDAFLERFLRDLAEHVSDTATRRSMLRKRISELYSSD